MKIQNQVEEQFQSCINKISDLLPAVDIVTKNYSLEPDMAFGWKPKMKIVGPIPLNFDNNILDVVVQELTGFGKRHQQRVIYLGARPQSSYKLHQQSRHQYEFKYAYLYHANYNNLTAFYRKFYSHFQSKGSRLFKGMNPTINMDEQFIFDSNYQSGNLDAAIRIAPNEYDLFMRIDSNTRGHTQWYNFTVKNKKLKSIKFNICNFRKQKTLLQRGMKPYIFSKYLYSTKGIGWKQSGQNVRFIKQSLRYKILQQEYSQNQISFYFLKFQYNFEVDNDEVSFAYCPPYTYSQMLRFVAKLQQKDKKQQYIRQTVFCQSLSGLTIPLLTITNFSVPDRNKKCILVSSRIHPGQSNSSYMIQGFLEFLCNDSKQAAELRKNTIVKVIPMLNPDGVVMGNFRTSLCGKDLNRVFKAGIDMLFPQVKFLKQLVSKLKQQYNNRLLLFLDFHGHSLKKNVFVYGPEYHLYQTNYYKTRIFPKILANKTEMFRYYSCKFRVAYFKRTTARAVLLKTIPHCYTVEASTGFYYSREEKKDIQFKPNIWADMGRFICEGLKDFIDLILQQQFLIEQKKKKLKQYKLLRKRQKLKNIHDEKYLSIQKYLKHEIPNNSKLRQGSVNSVNNNYQYMEMQFKQLPLQTQKLINQIKKQQQSKKQLIEEEHDSDKFSEGGSDSESKGDDLEEEQSNKLDKNIIDSIQQFQLKFFKKQKQLVQKRENKMKSFVKQKQKLKQRKIQLIPSLRKKIIEESSSEIKRNSLHKNQAINWNRIQQQFLFRTSNLKNATKYFNRTQLNPLQFTNSPVTDPNLYKN